MKITDRLITLFTMNQDAFINQLFIQTLNRPPASNEYEKSASLLATGHSRLMLLTELLSTDEAEQLCTLPSKPIAEDALLSSAIYPSLPASSGTPAKSFGPLKGVLRKTSDWIHHYTGNAAESTQLYTIFEPDSPAYIEPKGLDSTANHRFQQHLLNNPLAEQFVAIIPGGRIIGEHGVVISPDDFVLWDLSPDLAHPVPEHAALSRTNLPPAVMTSETLAVLSSPISFSYYHWFYEVLARIDLLKRSKIPTDRYVINRSGIPFQNETLAALGISSDQIIDCHADLHLQAKHLVVPSFGAYTGHVPKWACDFLYQELRVNRRITQSEKYHRVYISRADAMYRRVMNELEVMRILEACGFTCVTLGRLSAREQAEIFSSAQIIVAPHGAGLTNLVYCDEGTKLVELFTPSFLNPTFWMTSLHRKLDYYYLIGTSSKGLLDGWDGTDDIIVDLDQLMQLLRMAGVSEGRASQGDASIENNARNPSDLKLYEYMQELLCTEDCEFVTKACRSILGIDPDRSRLEHYVGMYRQGTRKLHIISDILHTNEMLHI